MRDAVRLTLAPGELRTLLCAVGDALEKARGEARMGGCMGAAARRLAPKYHEMLGRLERAHDDALRAREEGDGGGAETGKEHEKGK